MSEKIKTFQELRVGSTFKYLPSCAKPWDTPYEATKTGADAWNYKSRTSNTHYEATLWSSRRIVEVISEPLPTFEELPISLPAEKKMTTDEPFWMVWCPGIAQGTVKHESWQSAEAEASKLATSYPGKNFYVLQAVSKAATPTPPAEVTLLVPRG